MCVDISKATKNVHASSSRLYTLCKLIMQEIRAYFENVELLHVPMLASTLRSLVFCITLAA